MYYDSMNGMFMHTHNIRICIQGFAGHYILYILATLIVPVCTGCLFTVCFSYTQYAISFASSLPSIALRHQLATSGLKLSTAYMAASLST